MSALRDFVALMEEVVLAGDAARRAGRDQHLECGRCLVDAVLDAASFDQDCPTHAALLDAYQSHRKDTAP